MRRAASVSVLLITAAAAVAACTANVTTPMTQPKEVMQLAWGPFARQCTSTRTSHDETGARPIPREVTGTYEVCSGFAAMPLAGDAVEITVSTATSAAASTPIISRMQRAPSGLVNLAAPEKDTGLLAQGSDEPELAATLTAEIGLTRKQVIDPSGRLRLPVVVYTPSPVMGTLSCRPDGGGVDHGRETLVFTCTLDENVRTDRVDARLRLAGVEEVDSLTGVRLSGALSGSLSGHQRFDAQSRWQPADLRTFYRRTTEFE